MYRYLALSLLVLTSGNAIAQKWMPQTGGPVKYEDVVANYRREHPEPENDKLVKHGKAVLEDENYKFNRWCWYWKQHLDSNGYIVNGNRTVAEWRKFSQLQTNVAAKTTASSNWVFQGPSTSEGGYSGMGRINAIAFDPIDSNTIYIGSAAGSTWKTTNGGNTWTCLYDNMANLSVSDLKVNPQNRNTIYVATGDANGTDNYSTGVIKSHDGGTTWVNAGITWPMSNYTLIRTLLINPLDTNKLMLGTNIGIFKTNNGGATWTNVASGNYRQILYSPFDTSVVIAAMEPSPNSQLAQSTDGGYTWNTVTSFSGTRRINIAVTPAAPNVVKAIVTNTDNGLAGIYGSEDYGATYTPYFLNDASCTNNILGYDIGLPSTSCDGQGWYDLCIAIDPNNANNVVIGGINNYYSADAGLSWTIANQWWDNTAGLETVHADKHWLGYNTLTGGLYLGCDGGIYKNYSPLTGAWTDLSNGIGITQFYRNAVDNNASFVLGGAQDNGTKMLNAGVSTDLTGGDGMQPLFNYSDPETIFYCAYQNGYVDITTDGGATFNSITEDLPTPGAWITPYTLHPSNSSTLLIGYKRVYISYDNGSSWEPLSPPFSSSSNIEILKVSIKDPGYIYAVRDNGWRSKIHFTKDLGVTWDTIPVPFTNSITDLEIDPDSAQKITVTISGYATNKVATYSGTTNSWIYENAGLPNVPANCIVSDTFSKTRYIGTDAAVFYKTKEMTSWALYNTNLPNVIVSDLNINHTTSEIWAATYGRGMWKSIKADETPVLGLKDVVHSYKMTISPNPSRGSFTISTTEMPFRNATATVRLMTTDGRIAQTSEGKFDNTGILKVNISNLAPGFYFCELSNAKGTSRGKIVVY